jgi:O-antigen ligase
MVGLFGITTLGLALTGGRTGYATWCAVGLIMSLLKWRKYLLVAPVALAAVVILAPGVPQRLLQGIQGGGTNQQLITSGRSLVWPFVLEKIRDAPLTGYGRQAWVRTNLRLEVTLLTGENFGHPHNAYLEFALDSGLIGLAVLVPLFLLVLWNTARMFRDRDPTISAAGGAAFALTLSWMIAALGAQTFYPREGMVGMWCVIALATRVAWDLGARNRSAAPVRPRVGASWGRPAAGPATMADRLPQPPRGALRPGGRLRQWPR